jgi:hypothetical protein
MAHGYMREFDEDRGRDDMRERGIQRNRDFMMGDRNRSWDEDRNFDRGHDQASSSRSRSPWDDGREWFGGDPNRSQRARGSNQDDHYRSWRDKQMEALDRDYADYCREREQQFHSDFDTWRSQRRDNVQPLQAGMTQTSTGTDPEGTLDLTTNLETSSQDQPAMADAAVGTAPNRNRR